MTDKANKIFDFLIEKRYAFALIFMGVSFSTFAFLYATGLIPEELKATRTEARVQAHLDEETETAINEARMTNGRVLASVSSQREVELPVRVVVDKIGVDSIILNPGGTSVTALDEELRKGAVRYPGSGKPGDGNMLVFGHSTNRAIVNNPVYKTFNGLDKLNPGDTIRIESEGRAYVYKVFSVKLTTADEALVQFDNGRNMLTLSTCNTFGGKEERYVVEADFVESKAI